MMYVGTYMTSRPIASRISSRRLGLRVSTSIADSEEVEVTWVGMRGKTDIMQDKFLVECHLVHRTTQLSVCGTDDTFRISRASVVEECYILNCLLCEFNACSSPSSWG